VYNVKTYRFDLEATDGSPNRQLDSNPGIVRDFPARKTERAGAYLTTDLLQLPICIAVKERLRWGKMVGSKGPSWWAWGDSNSRPTD